MAEVKWIKITTDMFEDEKIDFILSLPEDNSLLIIWIRLLTMAGKCNSNGFIFLTENIPYSEDMLANKFKISLNIVKLAFSTFEKLGMIEINEEGYIYLPNWGKHQNIEGLEKIREQNRLRKQKQREREKLKELEPDSDVPGQSHDRHATDIDKELDIEEDIEIYKAVVGYLNEKTNKNYKHSAKATKRLIKSRLNEGYTLDDFKNVINIKTVNWLRDPNMNKFLRPETLFGSKFESYLNEQVKPNTENNDYGW